MNLGRLLTYCRLEVSGEEGKRLDKFFDDVMEWRVHSADVGIERIDEGGRNEA